ncbi:hypothetical protein [Pantoea sp.]|uniref:hypothetical protein n=1 Tax=Pantoea sp. TaxID=69393 RepID=UPI0028968B88|nr:hypothetical protein [Pantoea sp.]
MKGITYIGIYFDPDRVQVGVHQPDGAFSKHTFVYDEAITDEIEAWLAAFAPATTHVCLIENETAAMLADELADKNYYVFQITFHELISWFAAAPPAEPDGTPVNAMIRYLRSERPARYESRTPQLEVLYTLLDELEAFEDASEEEEEELLSAETRHKYRNKGLSISEIVDRRMNELHELIREHLMIYPELMTPELFQEFFPDVIDALEQPKH